MYSRDTLANILKLAYIPPLEQYNGILILLSEPNDPYKKSLTNARLFQ